MSFVSSVLRFVTRKPSADISWTTIAQIEEKIYRGDIQAAIDMVNKQIDETSGFDNYYFKTLKLRVLAEGNDLDSIGSLIEELEGDVEDHPLKQSILNSEKVNFLRLKGDFPNSLQLIESTFQDVSSLKLYYPIHFKRTTIRLDIIQGKIGNRTGDFETSIQKLNEAINLLSQVGDETGKAEAYNDLGISYSSLGDAENGLDYLNRSLSIYNDLKNKNQSLKIYNNIGMIEMGTGKLDDALNSFNQSLTMTRELGITRYSAVILQNIALIYYQTGKLEESLVNFNEAMKLFEELNVPPNVAKVQLNVAGIYQLMGDYNKALSLMKTARKTFEEFDMKQDLAEVLSNIANIQSYNGFYKQALDLIKQSIELYEEIGNYRTIAYSFYNGVDISIKLGNLEEAEGFLTRFDQILKQNDNKLNQQLHKLSKALILLESDRVVKQAEAQTLLQEIADDEVINIEYTVESLLKLGDLLLKELRISASEEALQEFKNLINRLDDVTKTTDTQSAEIKPTIIQVLMLKSKLALIDLEVDNAQTILNDAHNIAKSAGLRELMKSIDHERETIKNEMMKYKKMVDTNASLYERLQESQIENYLKRAESILKK